MLNAANASLNPGGQPMLIIGLFQQNCNRSKNNSNHTVADSMLCQVAIKGANRRKHEFWKFLIRQGKYRINGKMNANDFEYEAKTFCYQQEAVKFLTNVKLNSSYYVNNAIQEKPKWNRINVQNWRSTSRVIQIIIYSEDVATSKILRSLLYGEDFIVTFVNHNLPDYYGGLNIDINANFLEHNARALMSQINSNFAEATYYGEKRSYDVHYIGIIHIRGDSLIYEKEFEYFYRNYVIAMYQDTKLCHFVYNLNGSNPNDVKNLAKHLVHDTDLKFIILYGSPEDQYTFYMGYLNYCNSLVSMINYPLIIIVFHDVRKEFFDNFPTTDQRRYSFWAEGFLFSSSELLTELIDFVRDHTNSNEFDSEQKFVVQKCGDIFDDQMIRMAQIVHLYEKFDLFRDMTFKKFKQHCMNRSKKRKRNLREFLQIEQFKERFFTADNPTMSVLKNHYCPKPKCGKGRERYFGQIYQNIYRWNDSYGYSCRKCASNHIKYANASDDLPCSLCPSLTKASKDKSHCFDPYTEDYLHINDIPTIASVAVSGLGFLLTLFAISVFFKYRETSFVKASDLSATIQHLISMQLTFVTLPLLFIGKPSNWKCLMQPLTIAIICVFPSTIILLKSQKILTLFQSKTRLSKGAKRKSLAVQLSTAFVIILIDCCLLFLSFYSVQPNVVIHHDHENYVKKIYCNTGSHNNIQIAYLILLHLLSCIQAYRSRNLPEPFNEALSIVYSTFLVVMVYINIFPIYYLQNNIKMRSVVYIMIIPISNICFLLVFYGAKLHLVLCQSHKNTKEHFRSRMLKDSREKVEMKLSGK